MTVQVKTVERATPADGTGWQAIGRNFPHDTPAQLLAVTLLEDDLVWLFTAAEARRVAQQRSPREVRHLYWYTDLSMRQRDSVPFIQLDMAKYWSVFRFSSRADDVWTGYGSKGRRDRRAGSRRGQGAEC